MTNLIEKGDVRQWIPDEVLAAHEAEGWKLLASWDGEPLEYYILRGKALFPDMKKYREEMWKKVKILRDEHERSICETPLGRVQCDDISVMRIVTLTLLAMVEQDSFSEVFTMADDTEMKVNASEMISIGTAVSRHKSKIHARSEELRAEMERAVNLDILNSIDIENGWPD
jgi:hypothetical protein